MFPTKVFLLIEVSRLPSSTWFLGWIDLMMAFESRKPVVKVDLFNTTPDNLPSL